ncbi:MAG TPA: response regulator, partial [Bryobacteraceae bacterium]|nr:response regulator [Bryobacteraceae bacterium]
TPREGSAFRITFPAAAEPAPAPPPAAAHEGATVLVVDDEEMVRRVAKATLEANGWRVLLANDGLAAIEQVREHSEIGLILLDLTMPVMNGEEALDQILEARPGVKVVVSTGYGNREATARFGTSRVAGFLQKPYTARQLAETVRTVSGAGQARSHAD